MMLKESIVCFPYSNLKTAKNKPIKAISFRATFTRKENTLKYSFFDFNNFPTSKPIALKFIVAS